MKPDLSATLGRRQRTVLRDIGDYGCWHSNRIIVGDRLGATRAVVRTLMARGLLCHTESGRYYMTMAGYAWLIMDAARDLAQCSADSEGCQRAAERIQHLGALAQAEPNWHGEAV
jgi:hypothetical protein